MYSTEQVASWLVRIAFVYTLGGLFFALVFVFHGVNKIDPAAREGTLGFRLAILAGSAALWPLLLRRWIRGGTPPVERNAHRDAVSSSR